MKRFFATTLVLLSFILQSGCDTSGKDVKPAVLKEYDTGPSKSHPPGPKQQAPVKLAVATEPVREAAAEAETPPIIPFQRWDMPETAAQALGRIGAAAVPELSRALRDPNPLVRKRAADILARIGPDAKEAVPVLIQTLDDPDEDVRKAAVRALGEIGPAAKDAVPHLINALREPGKINATR